MPSCTPGLNHMIISSACFPVPGLGKPSVSVATRSPIHTFTRSHVHAFRLRNGRLKRRMHMGHKSQQVDARQLRSPQKALVTEDGRLLQSSGHATVTQRPLPQRAASALPGRFGLGRSAERVCHSPEVTAARSEEQGDSPDRSWAGWARLQGLRHLRRSARRAPVSPRGCPRNSPVRSASRGPPAPPSEGKTRRSQSRGSVCSPTGGGCPARKRL